MKRLLITAALFAIAYCAEAQTVRSSVGTVSAIDAQNGTLAIKPDNGEPFTAKISATTILQGISPGEKDLRKAQPIALSQIAVGDRVLVSIEPGTSDARRIVVMAAVDIDKRNQADRQAWLDRGVVGVVTAKKGKEVTLTAKYAGAERTIVVALTDGTTFRRYAPDSVRFADARSSRMEEIEVGDQLRARGEKSADGLHLSAEDVVFGTFLTKAGSVTSVDAAAGEVRITELGTGKPLLVKLTADTQIKAMPELPANGPVAGGAPFGGQQGGRGGAAPEFAAGAPVAAAGGPFAGPPGARGGAGFRPPDPSEMIELMPRAGTDAIRQGQTILISSTKGAKPEELTAIIVVANAQMLIQMASTRAGAGRGGPANSGGDLSPGVMSGGMGIGGLDLSGMVP